MGSQSFGAAVAMCLVACMGNALPASAQDKQKASEASFRAIYQELVETNTTLSAGSCTLAAEMVAARLRAAGFTEEQLHLIVPAELPKQGNLVVVVPGRDASAKAVLLLAHLDVVEADRKDWERDPFTLIEDNGYFYARGSSDDKAQAAIWIDTLIRLRQEGFRPHRTIKMALTCGEETPRTFDGADYLVKNHRDLIDAEFALNEGAGGLLDGQGNPVALYVEAGEKFPQTFVVEVTNPGGHSSLPVKDNAITRMSRALVRVGDYEFPFESNETTRAYFSAMSKLTPPPAGPAMAAFAINPADTTAAKQVADASPGWNAVMRTTCVSTMIEGGHATNALPQRVTARVNCRLFPGAAIEAVRQQLERIIGDPQVKISAPALVTLSAGSASPRDTVERSMSGSVLQSIRAASAKVFPGVPVVPTLFAGATDGSILAAAGIPTYGFTGILVDAEGSRSHGLNERVRVQSLMDARKILYGLVKAITS